MKIILESYDDSEEDCTRNTFVTRVDGKEYCLAPCSLGSWWTWLEIQESARKFFGADVEIEIGENCAGLERVEPEFLRKKG
jgi:hypothetical protein